MRSEVFLAYSRKLDSRSLSFNKTVLLQPSYRTFAPRHIDKFEVMVVLATVQSAMNDLVCQFSSFNSRFCFVENCQNCKVDGLRSRIGIQCAITFRLTQRRL